MYHRSFGCVKVVIFCKYWIVNRTGLPALYKPNTRMFAFEKLAPGQKGITRGNVSTKQKGANCFTELSSRQLHLEGDSRDWYSSVDKITPKPLLFSFADDDVQTRNRNISVKIANSEWSKVNT